MLNAKVRKAFGLKPKGGNNWGAAANHPTIDIPKENVALGAVSIDDVVAELRLARGSLTNNSLSDNALSLVLGTDKVLPMEVGSYDNVLSRTART